MTTMTATDEFLAKLNPKIAKAVTRAVNKETTLLPMASQGMTDALGGGIGRGRITLIHGNPASGKSAVTIESIGKWQKQGLVCAYVDVEGTWDNAWAKRLGVNVDDLILIEKRSVSRVYNAIRPLLEAGIDVIAIDSISMAMPDAFIGEDGLAKDLENHKQIGAKAKALTALVNGIHYSNENTAVILISQQTTDFSGQYAVQIPDGGKKVLFATSQIIRLTASQAVSQQIKKDITIGSKIMQVPVARRVAGVVEKNKVAPPGRTFEYTFYYEGKEVGIDRVGEIVDEAITFEVIKKGGSWFKYGDSQWQGKDAVVDYAKENPEFVETLVEENRKARSVE